MKNVTIVGFGLLLLLLILGCTSSNSSNNNSTSNVAVVNGLSGGRTIDFQSLEYDCKASVWRLGVDMSGFKISDQKGGISKILLAANTNYLEWDMKPWFITVDTFGPAGNVVYSNSGDINRVGRPYSCLICYAVLSDNFISAPYVSGGKVNITVISPTGEQVKRTMDMPSSSECN
ncbi:MAG: hypothetical protein NTY48_05835 [Candidatus Diapherotrites archaeon]|nr:hypothetical protein [Candidatus Diapherotrites archaeon]